MSDPPRRPGLARTSVHVALLLLLPAFVFSNTLENGYHLDDQYRIVSNTQLERVWPPWRHFLDPSTSTSLPSITQYRPFLPLSYTLTHALADLLGLERLTVGHLGNIGIHLASVVLLYFLVRELLRFGRAAHQGQGAGVALAAALLFGVHPVAGVPVNYLCARDLLLMQMFLGASLLVYVRMRRRGESLWGWVATCGLLACSLLSKTNALLAPGVVLVLELVLGGGRLTSGATWRRVGVFAAVAAGFLAWTRWGLGFSDADQLIIDHRPPLEYPLTQLDAHLSYYARNLVWPFRMRPEARIELTSGLPDLLGTGGLRVLTGLAFVTATLALAWRWRRRTPLVSFAILAYWVLFSMTGSLLPMRRIVTDYRQYAPLAFAAIAVAAAAGHLLPALPRRLLALAAVLYLGTCSWILNDVWRDGRSLWGQSVRYGASATAHLNYGRSLMGVDPELAEKHLREALRMSPGNIYALINLGMLQVGQGDPTGVDTVAQAVKNRPDWGITHKWHAAALSRMGRHGEAAAARRRAADAEPSNLEYQYQAGLALQRTGDFDGSLAYLRRLHALVPEYKNSLPLESWALQQSGRSPEAIERYRTHLRAQPEDSQARFNLAFTLQKEGRLQESVEEYREVLAREPGHYQAHFNLAYALMDTEAFEDAIDHFRRCLELKADYNEVHRHLATCLAALDRPEEAAAEQALYATGLSSPGG